MALGNCSLVRKMQDIAFIAGHDHWLCRNACSYAFIAPSKSPITSVKVPKKIPSANTLDNNFCAKVHYGWGEASLPICSQTCSFRAAIFWAVLGGGFCAGDCRGIWPFTGWAARCPW